MQYEVQANRIRKYLCSKRVRERNRERERKKERKRENIVEYVSLRMREYLKRKEGIVLIG